jgi:sulfur-oxidizing protein SoxB
MVRVGGMSYHCAPKAKMGNRISNMVLTRTGSPIEAMKSYTVGGWASVNPETEGPAIYDLLESYITNTGVVTPSGDQSVIVEGMG